MLKQLSDPNIFTRILMFLLAILVVILALGGIVNAIAADDIETGDSQEELSSEVEQVDPNAIIIDESTLPKPGSSKANSLTIYVPVIIPVSAIFLGSVGYRFWRKRANGKLGAHQHDPELHKPVTVQSDSAIPSTNDSIDSESENS